MKKEVIKLLTVVKCICFIALLFGLYQGEMKTAYAAGDTKVTGVTASAKQAYWPASDAIDEPADSDSWWTTNEPGESWLMLTFDKVYYIDRWYVINYGIFSEYSAGADANNTRDYKLQSSMDGVSWTDIDVVDNNTQDITDRTVTPFTAKYVRIYITEPVQDESSITGCAAIVDFEVFAVAPVITSVAVPASATYTAGQSLNFTVNYSADVIVTGTPYIPVTIGTKTAHAEYISGSGTRVLTFRYTLQSGDYDADGIELGTSINLGGGTIRDFVSNSANLALINAGATSGVSVDARTKHSISVSGLTDGTITTDKITEAVGETVTLTITPASGKKLKEGSLKYNDGSTDYTITGTSFTMPDSNVTISAVFEDISYAVVVDSLTGGIVTADKTKAISGETVNLTITPDTGMQLKSGSLKYYDGTQYIDITGTSFTMPETDVTVFAEFEAKKYTVQFNPNWTVIVPDAEVSHGEKVTAPTVDTPGVRQDGWYSDSSFNTIWNFTTDTVLQDMTLYLKYTPVGNVAFNSNGGDTVSPQTVGSGEKVQEPSGMSKSGFVLDGWYLASDFSGARYDFNVTASSTEANQMRTLYAKWIPLYSVTVESLTGGSITANPVVAEEGDPIILTITPGNGKQLKNGSLKYNDGTNDIAISGISFIMPAANVTVSAEFEDIPSTVLIGSITGGSVTADKAIAAMKEIVNLTITPNTGMQLKAGSLKYYDGTQYVAITGTSFAMPETDVTVSVEFEAIQYTVQFNPNWTVTVPDAEVNHGEKITVPTVDTPGVRQDGWYSDSSFSTIWNFTTDTVLQDMTLYLKYTPIGNVAFESNGGDIISSQTVGSGEKIQEPVGVSKAGFVLDGWYLTSDYSGARYDFNMVASSTEANQMRTLYAKWIPLYSVTTNVLQGGSIIASPVVAEAGDTIVLAVIPDSGKQLKTGSLKYNDGANDTAIIGNSFIMPAVNVTVSAEFEDIPVIPVPSPMYSVAVGSLTGGSISASQTLAVSGSSITMTIIPDPGKQLKAGSLKYNDGSQDTVISGTSFILPAANVMITAEFEDAAVIPVPSTTYTITAGSLTGGSVTANPSSALAGEMITLTITPDSGKRLKEGSLKYNDGTQEVTITGTSFAMPAANVIITAEFEDIPVIPEPSTDTTLVSIGIPAAITGVANGTAKSAAALGLPAAVTIITSGGNSSTAVVWDVASSTYDQSSLSAQSFTVTGSLTLPIGVVNTNNINLSVMITVSVNQGSNPDSNAGGSNDNGNGTGGNNPGANTDNNTNTNTNADTNTSTNLPRIEGSETRGWDSITQYIANNNTGNIKVDMNGETTVAQEIFKAVKGKDIDLTFDLGNGIEWIINGTDIPENTDISPLPDIDFNLSMNTDNIPEELLNAITETDKVQISLDFDGSFGFTATVRLPVEEKYSGKFANLFYYNPVTNRLELQAVGVVNENGTVEFPFTHASDYVIVMSATAMLEDAITQISVTPEKKTLYVGGTKESSDSVKLVIPEVIQKAVSDGLCEMSITYKSSNPKVAAISGSGKITAKSTGTVTITTTIQVDGVEKSYQTTIKVKKAYIKLSKSTKTMKLGECYSFKATGYGVETEDILFTTSQKSIVTINKRSGVAVAKSTGVDYVIAKVGDTEIKIKVSVK